MSATASLAIPVLQPTSVNTALITAVARFSPREIVVDAAGQTLTASQYPTETTGWWETELPNGVRTWVPVVFTQTFATTVLDQLPPAQSGSIGLGDPNVVASAKENAKAKEVVATSDAEMLGRGVGCRLLFTLIAGLWLVFVVVASAS